MNWYFVTEEIEASNSPEVQVCGELGIDFQQGLGKKFVHHQI